MANSRNYSNTSVSTSLNGSLTNVATSVVLNSQTGMPTPPFLLSIEPDTASEELVLVTSGAGTGGSPYVVTRGQDGTSNISHSNAAVVQHRIAAVDHTDSRTHEAGNLGLHGLDSVNMRLGGGNQGITSSITVANTLTETNISKQYSISGAVSAGQCFHVFAGGSVACTGTPTLTFKLKYGSTILGTCAITFSSAASSDWQAQGFIDFQTVGGSGSVAGSLALWVPTANTAFTAANAMPTDASLQTSISTTGGATFSITATWSSASSSNTISAFLSNVCQRF